MPARWRVAKLVKMAKHRASQPRSLGVNWHNGAAMKAGHLDLELEGRVAEEMETRKPRAPNLQELGVTFNGLKFLTEIDNNFQKLRWYYTPKKDAWYVVHWNYQLKKCSVSMSYATQDRVREVWRTGRVRWKYVRKLA